MSSRTANLIDGFDLASVSMVASVSNPTPMIMLQLSWTNSDPMVEKSTEPDSSRYLMVMPRLDLASVMAAHAAWLNEWSAMPVLLIMMQAEKPALDAAPPAELPPAELLAVEPLAALPLLEELAHALTARAAISAMPPAAAARRCRGRGEAGGTGVLPITGDSLP